MSTYLDAMRALTERREDFNERTRKLHEDRGVPNYVPIVASLSDPEIAEYIAEGEALVADERAFIEKYHSRPGVDPNTIE